MLESQIFVQHQIEGAILLPLRETILHQVGFYRLMSHTAPFSKHCCYTSLEIYNLPKTNITSAHDFDIR